MKKQIYLKTLFTITTIFFFNSSKALSNSYQSQFTEFNAQTNNKSFYQTKSLILIASEKKDFNIPSSLKKLPNLIDLKSTYEIGKSDPFSLGSNGNSNEAIYIKLLGVFETNQKKFALIKNKNLVSEISEGYSGGLNNKILPNGMVLKKIDIDNNNILVESNFKKFIIEID